MKIFKISLAVVLLAFGYLFIVNTGLERYNLPGKGILTKIEQPLTKDLTFGVKLNCLPTKKVSSGLTTYLVYDENSIDAAEKMIYDWFNKSIKDSSGEGLAKMKAEIKLMNTAYEQIKSAERLTTDGTPEQKLLIMEKQMIAKLHDGLAEYHNMILRYGYN